MDINVDEDEPCDNYGSQSDGIGKISFSIAAILGETFGQNQKQMKIEPNQSPIHRYESNKLFRPFDFTSFASNPLNISASRAFISANSPSAFFNNFRLSEIFDSTKYTPHPHLNLNNKISDNKQQNNNNNKYHPKILQQQQHHHEEAQQQVHQGSNKIAPLGGLSKTISQIGQETTITAATATSTINKISHAKADINVKNQQPTNESVDSDSTDCNSEASTSKDETKMWPAWVSEEIENC
jgi:preprotein translocase subunit YajC